MDSVNFFRDFGVDADVKAISTLAVRSLRTAYGIRHPDELEYASFSREGVEIRFPTLGIRRRRR